MKKEDNEDTSSHFEPAAHQRVQYPPLITYTHKSSSFEEKQTFLFLKERIDAPDEK